VAATLASNSDLRKYRAPTSISGLSPSNPVLKALDKLPIEAPHNSIIGDRGRGDTPNSSDGVVPYWSSHLDSAQSELIVPTDHGAMKNPKTIAEIHRILLLQIGSRAPYRPALRNHLANRYTASHSINPKLRNWNKPRITQIAFQQENRQPTGLR
jgi:hypothetical protein